MLQRGVKFVGKFVSRAARSGALRATSLNHELRNHTMENQSVVERFLFLLAGFFVREFLRSFSESDEICDGLRCFCFEQAHHNMPLGSFEYGIGSCRSAHAVSLCTAQSYTTVRTPRHFGRGNKKVCGVPELVYFGDAGLPALLLAKLRDMRRMMSPVPFVEEEQPIQAACAMLRVNEHSCELPLFHGTPETIPAIVHGAEERERNFNGSRLRVGQICPGLLVVRFNCWFFFRKRELQSHISVQVAVRNVVDHLAHSPASFAVRSVVLLIAQPLCRRPQFRRYCRKSINRLLPPGRGHLRGHLKCSNRVARIHCDFL